jgi:hypothetical protein
VQHVNCSKGVALFLNMSSKHSMSSFNCFLTSSWQGGDKERTMAHGLTRVLAGAFTTTKEMHI